MRTHKAGWVRLVCSHFAIYFHQALVDNLLDLIVGESILESVTQEHGQWQAFT